MEDAKEAQVQRLVSVAIIAAIAVGWGAIVLVVNVGLVVALVATGTTFGEIAQLKLPPTSLVITTGVQFLAMAALSIGIARLAAPYRPFGTTASLLGHRRSLGGMTLLLAAACGATVGWLPGWLAATMRTLLPQLELGTIGLVQGVLQEGPWIQRLAMVAIVAVIGPVAEEWLFRGLLYDTVRRHAGPIGTVVATSLAFSAFHMDPVQGIPLLFTGAVFGALREVTGSVAPAIAAHIANNALGVALGVTAVSAEPNLLPSVIAALAALLALAGVARREAPVPA